MDKFRRKKAKMVYKYNYTRSGISQQVATTKHDMKIALQQNRYYILVIVVEETSDIQ